MPERCPLSQENDGFMLFLDEEDAEVCRHQCEGLMDTSRLQLSGEYDLYDVVGHKADCAAADYSDLEYSHSAIHKMDGPQRIYTIVDKCAE